MPAPVAYGTNPTGGIKPPATGLLKPKDDPVPADDLGIPPRLDVRTTPGTTLGYPPAAS